MNLNHKAGSIELLVEAAVKDHQIEVIFCGGLSVFVHGIRKVFAAARKANPGITCVAGGGVVSSDPDIACDLLGVDIGVIGEGEFTCIELLRALENNNDLNNVKGIAYRNNSDGSTIVTPDAPPVMDLSRIPWPDYDILEFDRHIQSQRPLDHHFLQTAPAGEKPRAIDMITSRSCPYSCTFCFHPVGKVYRERPLDEFFAELEHLKSRYQINMVGILDELFSLRKDRLREFCHRIKPFNLKWMVQLHVHSADPDILDLMRDSGCTYISYGIESMSLPVLHSMQKKTKPTRINTTLKNTYERKIGLQGNLIFGDTAETIDTANESMKWWSENRRYQIYLSRLQVYPGSPDYIMAIRDNMIKDRLTYSIDLPIFLNISNLNGKTLDDISFQLEVHGRSLLNTAREQTISLSTDQAVNWGTAWDIKFTCPDCNGITEFNNSLFRRDQSTSLRLFCQHCRSRVDIENTVADQCEPLTPLDPADGKYSASRYALLGGGSNLTDALKKLRKISSRPTAFRNAGKNLLAAPFDPTLHINFGKALTRLGRYGAAKMHFEHALRLAPDMSSATEQLNTLHTLTDYEEKKDIFFTVVGSESPPYRISRESSIQYDRKLEPNFPSYSRSVNRESIKTKRLPICFED